MRTHRIYTHTAIHTAPKTFVVIVAMLRSDPVILKELVSPLDIHAPA